MYLSVVLYELTSHLPSDDLPLVPWVKMHKYAFFMILIALDVLYHTLILLDPYSVKTVIQDQGQNYRICQMAHFFGRFITCLMMVDKFFLISLISLLAFMEWNTKAIYYEVRFIMFSIYSNILLILVALLIDFVHITNYYLHFLVQQCILIFMAMLTYICLYGYKLMFVLSHGENMAFIHKENKNFINDSDLKTQKTFNASFDVNYSFSTNSNITSINNYDTDKDNEYPNNRNGGTATTGNPTTGNPNGSRVVSGYRMNSGLSDSPDNNRRSKVMSRIISYHYSDFSSSNIPVNNDNNKDNNNYVTRSSKLITN